MTVSASVSDAELTELCKLSCVQEDEVKMRCPEAHPVTQANRLGQRHCPLCIALLCVAASCALPVHFSYHIRVTTNRITQRMSTKYKLFYFYFRGKGENIRQILKLAGVEFEDVRINWDQWKKMQSKKQFGQLPVLEVDGKELAQSKAIGRYLARKYGFAGDSDWEAAQIDAFVDLYEDLFQEVRPFYRVFNKLMPGDLNTTYEQIVQPARDKFLPQFERQLHANGSGFLVGSRLSWADTQIADHMYTFSTHDSSYAKEYPLLTAHLAAVHQTPRLREWIAARPRTVI